MSFPAQRVDLGSTFGTLFIGLIIGAVSVKYLFIAQAVDVEHFSILTYLPQQALWCWKCASFRLLLFTWDVERGSDSLFAGRKSTSSCGWVYF